MSVTELKNQLTNQTFEATMLSKKHTFNIEFKDSTSRILEDEYAQLSKWKIIQHKKLLFLNLNESKTLEISSIGKNKFRCVSLDNPKDSFTLTKVPIKWDKSALYGKWIEEKHVKNFPPPPPPLFSEIPDSILSIPPWIKISKDSVQILHALKSKSGYKINNTNEFIDLKLFNRLNSETSLQWEITSVNDSTMILNKFVRNHSSINNGKDWFLNIKYRRVLE